MGKGKKNNNIGKGKKHLKPQMGNVDRKRSEEKRTNDLMQVNKIEGDLLSISSNSKESSKESNKESNRESNKESNRESNKESNRESNKESDRESNKESIKKSNKENNKENNKDSSIIRIKDSCNEDRGKESKREKNTESIRQNNTESNTVISSEDKMKEKKPLLNRLHAMKENIQIVWKSFSEFIDTKWKNSHISRSNLTHPLLFFFGTILYLELVLHLFIFQSMDMKMIYPILFAIPISACLTFIIGLFHAKGNRFVMWLLTGLTCIVFQIQLVYYYVFKVLFSFQTIGMAGDAISEFSTDIFTAIKANIGGLFLLCLPLLILLFLGMKQIDFGRRSLKGQGILLGGFATFHLLAVLTLLIFGKGDYSPYDLYFNSKVHDLCGKQLGITTMTRMDIGALLLGREELVLADTINIFKDQIVEEVFQPLQQPSPIPTPHTVTPEATKHNITLTPTLPPSPTPIDTSPNVMDIDFNILAKQEKNDTIQTLHNYFATATPTNKNEYTGMFKGYNLIMITAEGFSPYAVNEQKTPTLYRLVREGFVFNNFYTALWQTSTSDGEYVAMTGLIPIGTRNMFNGRANLWPFSLGNQFNRLGVESKAYHNHTYTYYQRNETHPNLGYIFKAKGNGLVLEHPDSWPASDIELMEASVEDFTDEDQFHIYYLTVSGHMNYTFEGNSMSYKNRELVKDLPYSSDARAYIACQMELDRALELLLKKLEQAGVADRTVIALSADHYPYGWEKEKLDELAGHQVDPNFEIYKNHFILWNAAMKETIVVEEPCSSLDIVPTLSNLFGLEYDSRLLMGQDILSDAAPLVLLSNRSFITDKVMYNSETGEVTNLTEEVLPENYISNLNKVIKNKFTVSESILKNDYYRYVFPNGVK